MRESPMNRQLIPPVIAVSIIASPAVALSPGWEPCGHTNAITSPDQDVKAMGVPQWALDHQRRDALKAWHQFMANGYKTPGAPDWANKQQKSAGPFIVSPDDPAWANHALCNPAKRLYVFMSSVGLDGKTGPQTTPALELAARQHATPIPEPCFASILTGHTIPNLCANGCTATCPAQLPKSSPKAAIRTQQSALVPSATKTQIGH
jgi:hypothetical protein